MKSAGFHQVKHYGHCLHHVNFHHVPTLLDSTTIPTSSPLVPSFWSVSFLQNREQQIFSSLPRYGLQTCYAVADKLSCEEYSLIHTYWAVSSVEAI
jgi:hypothetical protein